MSARQVAQRMLPRHQRSFVGRIGRVGPEDAITKRFEPRMSDRGDRRGDGREHANRPRRRDGDAAPSSTCGSALTMTSWSRSSAGTAHPGQRLAEASRQARGAGDERASSPLRRPSESDMVSGPTRFSRRARPARRTGARCVPVPRRRLLPHYRQRFTAARSRSAHQSRSGPPATEVWSGPAPWPPVIRPAPPPPVPEPERIRRSPEEVERIIADMMSGAPKNPFRRDKGD